MNILGVQAMLEQQYPFLHIENIQFVSASKTKDGGTSHFTFDVVTHGIRLEKEIWITEQDRTNKTLQELMN